MMEMVRQGGVIVYILIALNIFGLALVLTKFFLLLSFRFNIGERASAVIKRTQKISNPQVFMDLLKDNISREISSLEKGFSFIRIIGTTAPLLGLLGTVWGIFTSFQVISAQGMGNPSVFAGGISSALITTVAGLIVGIPHIMSYQLLLGQLDYLEGRLEEKTQELVFKDL